MLRRTARNLTLALAAPAAFAACASVPQSGTPPTAVTQAAPTRRDTRAEEAHALHLLNRLTFGPRPGDVAAVMKMGAARWIDQQLSADTSLDVTASLALAGCPLWSDPVETAEGSISGRETFDMSYRDSSGRMITGRVSLSGFGFRGLVTRDSAANAVGVERIFAANNQLIACKYARVEFSEKQLLEVMTDFWHNHFSIAGSKVPARGSVIAFDRATIRTNALGKFRDLLGAVAHSPSMLEYLDNAFSQADPARRTLSQVVAARDPNATIPNVRRSGLNENYARELLELHTLGVDGGYSQQDVIEVARALTGWTHSRSSRDPDRSAPVNSEHSVPTVFIFDSAGHDAEAKSVLGHALPGGRGVEDGEEVLDILARHASTARFIARKLAVRFVSDNPPESLIDLAAQVFMDSDGDIRAVVRAIVTSSEFEAPNVVGTKVKSPLEFVFSLRRVFNAPVDTAGEQIDLLIFLRQTPYGRLTPDGWPETGSPWLTAGAMKTKLEIINRVAYGEMTSIPIERWPEWTVLSTASFDVQLSGVIASLLNGQASGNTRAVMASARPVAGAPVSSVDSLRELIVLALSSPEFMRR